MDSASFVTHRRQPNSQTGNSLFDKHQTIFEFPLNNSLISELQTPASSQSKLPINSIIGMSTQRKNTPYTPITLRPSLLTSQQNLDLRPPNQTHYTSTQMTTTDSLNTQVYEDNPQASAQSKVANQNTPIMTQTTAPQVSAQPRSYRVSSQFEPVEMIGQENPMNINQLNPSQRQQYNVQLEQALRHACIEKQYASPPPPPAPERIIPKRILNIPQPELVWRNDPIESNYYHLQQNGFVLANEEILMSQLENAHHEENESLNDFAERVRKLLRKKIARYSYQMFNLAKNMVQKTIFTIFVPAIRQLDRAKIFKLTRDLLLLCSIYNDFYQLFKK